MHSAWTWDTASASGLWLADRLRRALGGVERERTEMSVEMKIGSAIAPLFFLPPQLVHGDPSAICSTEASIK